MSAGAADDDDDADAPAAPGFMLFLAGVAFWPAAHWSAVRAGMPAYVSGYRSFWNVSADLRGTWNEMGT